MRITKLRRIKLLLDQIVSSRGYFIFIAPLLDEHYNRYIELIRTNHRPSESLAIILTNEDVLRDTVASIDVRTDILVNTNLYVSRISTDDLDLRYDLIEFVNREEINYRFLLADDELIRELENNPGIEINE
jgi:hypothetical protein